MASPVVIIAGGLIGIGGLVTAIVVPQLINSSGETTKSQKIEKKETREKVELKSKENFEKNCLLIAKSDDRAILACKKFNSSSEVGFYLYKKEGGKETFIEVKQIGTWDHLIIQVTPSNPKPTDINPEIVTFSSKQGQWIDSINRSQLKDKCQVDWTDLGKKELKVECNFQRGKNSVNVGEFEKFSLTQIG